MQNYFMLHALLHLSIFVLMFYNLFSTAQHEIETNMESSIGKSLKDRECKKNSGHAQFIPAQDLTYQLIDSYYSQDELPEGLDKTIIYNAVKASIPLSVRIKLNYVSKDRPGHPYPFGWPVAQTKAATAAAGCTDRPRFASATC